MTITENSWRRALEQRHGPALQAAFENSCVAVCGLGGLGSNIASLLARAGIGHLIIADFDRVELTNLHRQQYKLSQLGKPKCESTAENISEFAPFIKLETHVLRITRKNASKLLGRADVICEAFDSAESKAELAEAVLCELGDKYLIASSGMAGLGDAKLIKTRRISEHFYVCGDGVSDISSVGCMLSSRVALCAAHQAHLALQLIAEKANIKTK